MGTVGVHRDQSILLGHVYRNRLLSNVRLVHPGDLCYRSGPKESEYGQEVGPRGTQHPVQEACVVFWLFGYCSSSCELRAVVKEYVPAAVNFYDVVKLGIHYDVGGGPEAGGKLHFNSQVARFYKI